MTIDKNNQFVVTNIIEYLEALKTLRSSLGLGENPNYQQLLFRGESKLFDTPCSSLLSRTLSKTRNSFIKQNTLQFEKNIIYKWKNACEFSEEIVYPDNPWILAMRARHFGIITRLVDWTSSPLVALWFACGNSITKESTYDENGEYVDDIAGHVYIVGNANYEGSEGFSTGINAVGHFNLEDGSTPHIDQESFYKTTLRASPISKKAECSDLFVFPPRDFYPRITRQRGLFHIANDGVRTPHVQSKISIPNIFKQSILKELKYMGVDDASLKISTPDSIASNLNKQYTKMDPLE